MGIELLVNRKNPDRKVFDAIIKKIITNINFLQHPDLHR